MNAPQPVATLYVRPQQAIVTGYKANLPTGYHQVYSQAHIDALLQRIAQLEGKTK